MAEKYKYWNNVAEDEVHRHEEYLQNLGVFLVMMSLWALFVAVLVHWIFF